MRVRLNEQSLEWLYSNRIFLQGYKSHGYRLRSGTLLHWSNANPLIEPYIGVFKGDAIPGMGAFSYSHSAIPLDWSLGRYCSIAWDVKFPGPRHPLELLSTAGFMLESGANMWALYLSDTNTEFRNWRPNPQKHGTIIGHDVWIGQDVSIMRGLKIGDGSVLAASSVVTKDVEPFAIVGGNPARFIRWRFPQDVRECLIDLRWWRYGFSALNKIDLSNIGASIQGIRDLLLETPEFQPKPIDLSDMPHDGVV